MKDAENMASESFRETLPQRDQQSRTSQSREFSQHLRLELIPEGNGKDDSSVTEEELSNTESQTEEEIHR